MPTSTDIEALVLRVLRDAREPLREVVLFDRVSRQHPDLSPQDLLSMLGRMATRGRLRVSVERNEPERDLPPFQPRFWRLGD